MIVVNGYVKLNKNDCRKVKEYYEQGLNFSEAFKKLVRENKYDFRKIVGLIARTDKWDWITRLIAIDMTTTKNPRRRGC